MIYHVLYTLLGAVRQISTNFYLKNKRKKLKNREEIIMKLQEGNVIKLQNGMRVYGLIPEKFVYSNRKTSTELTRSEIEIGKVYENDTNLQKVTSNIVKGIIERFSWEGVNVDVSKVVEFVKGNVPEQQKEQFSLKEGEFVVIKTTFDGGGTGHGQNDVYPDGYHVFCKALKNGEYDENGIEISFYQSGSFTCMITNISSVRDMKMMFI